MSLSRYPVKLGQQGSRDMRAHKNARLPRKACVLFFNWGWKPIRAGSASYTVDDGQRTVTTTDSDIASHEWSIPGPHAR